MSPQEQEHKLSKAERLSKNMTEQLQRQKGGAFISQNLHIRYAP